MALFQPLSVTPNLGFEPPLLEPPAVSEIDRKSKLQSTWICIIINLKCTKTCFLSGLRRCGSVRRYPRPPMAGEGWEGDIPSLSLPFRRLDLRAYTAPRFTP